ncbi:HelD family protein [Jatrophihabitans sp. YIM 134969]
MSAPDVLIEERSALEEADRALEHMKVAAAAVADYGVDALASESLGRIRAQRLAALAADPGVPAFFGRIDTVAQATDVPATDAADVTVAPATGDDGESFHIGRRHIRDELGDPLVIDWRAPMSSAFYRASPTDPMGVHRRRRFGFRDRVLTSFEDEVLDGPAPAVDDDAVSELLRAEIERPRTGPMRDIVATISPDQDDLVRADLDTSLCVQGAPGTGKTAVGLHRAAYLLYTYPERLRRSGVLVVGPNAAFLDYIEAVLPTLGESGVRQATVDDLVGVVGEPPVEPAAVAVLKGDARLAAALRRAVLRHVAKPVDDVVITGGPVGTRRFRVPVERLRRLVDDARREVAAGSLRWSVARSRLAAQVAEDVRRQREDAGGAPSDRETAALSRRPGVREFLDAVWPAIDPAALLARFYADDDFRRRCAPDLTDAEHDLLHRVTPAARRARRWTVADTVLLDEIRGLVDGVDTVGHVVVDEAQDLSPMQCRALARRCPGGSFTVLGDLAQATTPWAPGAWAPTLEALGHPEAVLRPLTVGYRVPGAVLEVTNRLLPLIAEGLTPASSLRAAPDALHHARVEDLVVEVEAALEREGTVGVIAADAAVDGVTARLADLAARVGTRLVVVPATVAKGLEFDTAVVVDPEAIVAAEPARVVGLRRLYVVLTRAVSRLVICGGEPVPELA